MRRRAAAVRLDLDHGQVEARRVPAPREELDVADAVALAGADDDGPHAHSLADRQVADSNYLLRAGSSRLLPWFALRIGLSC
jgi:hypothetical protein